VRLGPDGKPMIAIAPPPSDLCGRVFLTKPDERGGVKRARVVELIKDFEGNVAKNKVLRHLSRLQWRERSEFYY
jgi:hypothetical protein